MYYFIIFGLSQAFVILLRGEATSCLEDNAGRSPQKKDYSLRTDCINGKSVDSGGMSLLEKHDARGWSAHSNCYSLRQWLRTRLDSGDECIICGNEY